MSGSLLPLKTYANLSTPLFGTGSGGGAAISSFPDITCSTITVQDCFIGFGDGTHLSTIGGQLYYDNELVASLSSISSIGDWSLLPAISTVDMAGNSLSSIGVAEAGLVQIRDPGISTTMNLQSGATSNYIYTNVIGEPTAFYLTTGGQETYLTLVEATGPSTIAKLGFNSTLQGAYVLDQGNNAFTFSGGQFSAPAGAFSTLYTNNLSTQTFTAVSTTVFQETISSLNIVADLANFSTLWGQPSSFYFAPVSSISSLSSENITCSTLVAQTRVSTADLEVSSINGHEFTENTATISTIFSNNISSVFGDFQFTLLSTLQFNPSFNPNLDVNLGLGSLFGNLAGAATGAIGVVVGGAALGTGIAALTQARQTNNLGSPSSFELVNGTTQLQVSTVGQTVSSIFRFVSSLNDQTPGQEFFASTIIPSGTVCLRSVSDPLNTVSSPQSTIQYFGQWVSLDEVVPPASTISTFNQLFTSSIGVSTVAFPNDTSFRVGVPWANAGGVSTLELFWNGASPPLDADMRVGALVITGSDVGGINYSKDVLIQNQNAGNRLIVYPNASTIAYLSDIPAITSSFQTASVSSLTVSSVNGGIPYTTANPQPAPAVVSSFQTASISTATISSLNGGIPYTTANPPPGTFTTANVSSLRVSSIGDIGTSSISFTNADVSYLDMNSAGDITGVATNYVNFQAQGTGGQLAGYIVNAGGLGSSSNYATGPMFLNASSIRMSTNAVQFNTLSTNNATLTNLSFLGLSTVTFSTSTGAGLAAQPAGRLVLGGNDLDLGQQDLWCQQVRVGAGNPGGSAQTEVIWYSPDNLTTRGLGLGGSDLTLRLQSTINSGTNNGYLLDTTINRPFFSTINAGTSTALIAQYPSTNLASFGFSTLAVIPPLTYIASVYDSTTQTVAAANTSTPLVWNTTSLNLGGFTVGTSTLTAPVAGVYELNASIQLETTSGGTNIAEFWLTKNGNAVAQTNSKMAVVNNGDTLGTITIFDTAAVGDQYGWMLYSADNNMAATATAAGAVPAIPSIIFNTKRIG